MSGLLKRLRSLFKPSEAPDQKEENSNDEVSINNDDLSVTKTNEIMAKKTVITKVLDVNTSDAIVEFPQNRTLLVEQLTDTPPSKAEMEKDFTNLQDVLDHYQPRIKNFEYEDATGKTVKEDIAFHELKDFEPDSIVKNSQFLSDLRMSMESYEKLEQQLRRNKALREALADEGSKEALISTLQALLAELQQSK